MATPLLLDVNEANDATGRQAALEWRLGPGLLHQAHEGVTQAAQGLCSNVQSIPASEHLHLQINKKKYN